MTQTSKLLPSSRADGSVFSAADLGSEVKGQRDSAPCVADDSATSKTASFTPGPWSVGGRHGFVEVFGPRNLTGSPIIATMESQPREANARLIAAAPEMLAALQNAQLQIEYLHDKFQETGSGNATLYFIQAAIAKATGAA